MVRKKVAIVTGASRGMAAATARELHARGYDLALLSPSEGCEKLAAELGAIAVRGVIESADDLSSLIDAAKKKYGRIDAAVLSGGHAPHSYTSTLEIGRAHV